MITGKNYIGNTLSAKGKHTFRTFNPESNMENEALFTEATEAEIKQATALATAAFKVYGKMSGIEKSRFLDAIADAILALGDTLIATYCSESGLPSGRARAERARTIGQLRTFSGLAKANAWVEACIDTAVPDRKPIPKPDLRKMLIPLGPVVVFGASNFPLAYSTAGGDTASALAAGCPVIVKSHPMHAGTGELVAGAVIEAARKTGMPNGVFSNLNGIKVKTGGQLVKDPGVKAVGFTGSVKGGRALFDLGAQRPEPIPVFAEMGSINPVVLLPKAAKDKKWAQIYADSITLGTGQFCTNPGLILGIEGSDLITFITVLSEEILKKSPAVMLHPDINKNYRHNKSAILAQEGLSIAADYQEEVPANYAKQAVATVKGSVFMENPVLHQEVFGPFSLVVACENQKQLEAVISGLEGQLTGTLLGQEGELTQYTGIVEALQNRVGRVSYNSVPTGVEVCPSMMHGGPYPASTDTRFTAVGIHAIKRWARPVCYQSFPEELLPDALKSENPLGIKRLLNGQVSKSAL